jgi:hypothetical protein
MMKIEQSEQMMMKSEKTDKKLEIIKTLNKRGSAIDELTPAVEDTNKAKRLHRSIRAAGAKLYLHLFEMESLGWHKLITKPNSEENYTNFSEYVQTEFDLSPSTYFDNKQKLLSIYNYKELGLNEKIAEQIPARTYRLLPGYIQYLVGKKTADRQEELDTIDERINEEGEAKVNIERLEEEKQKIYEEISVEAKTQFTNSIVDKWNSNTLDYKFNSVKEHLQDESGGVYPPPPKKPIILPEPEFDRTLYDEGSRDFNPYKIVAHDVVTRFHSCDQFETSAQGNQICQIWIAIFSLERANKLGSEKEPDEYVEYTNDTSLDLKEALDKLSKVLIELNSQQPNQSVEES